MKGDGGRGLIGMCPALSWGPVWGVPGRLMRGGGVWWALAAALCVCVISALQCASVGDGACVFHVPAPSGGFHYSSLPPIPFLLPHPVRSPGSYMPVTGAAE